MALTMTLTEAIAAGDAFTIEAVAKRDAEQAHMRGYLAGVQDQAVQLRYALDTGPRTTPIAWFRFADDAAVAAGVLADSWKDLRVVSLEQEVPA